MPKFYFHIRSAFQIHHDTHGNEFESIHLARKAAIAAVREALSQCTARGRTIDGRSFEIADEHGNILDVIPFTRAIQPE